jgi:hypothetical protein
MHLRFSALLLVTLSSFTVSVAADRAETEYQPIGPPPGLLQPAVETHYNPQGTVSESRLALLTVRREDKEYPGFLLGIQDAATRMGEEPLQVAPFSKESLSDQHSLLRSRGAEVFLIDAPNPAEAMRFLQNTGFLEINSVLISQDVVKGPRPPMVIYSPVYVAERAGEEAIRQIGDVEKTVAYVPPTTSDEKERETILKMFRKPFDLVAPKVKLAPISEAQDPAVVVALTPEDSAALLKQGRKKYPNAKIILTGESDELREAFEAGAYDVRIRPDYNLILGYALREAKQRSEMPPVALPTADVHRKPPANLSGGTKRLHEQPTSKPAEQ